MGGVTSLRAYLERDLEQIFELQRLSRVKQSIARSLSTYGARRELRTWVDWSPVLFSYSSKVDWSTLMFSEFKG